MTVDHSGTSERHSSSSAAATARSRKRAPNSQQNGSVASHGSDAGYERSKTFKESEAFSKKMVEGGGHIKEILSDELLDEKLQEKLMSHNSKRSGGDGESVPETPPNENLTPTVACRKQTEDIFIYTVNIDAMAILLFLAGLSSRLLFLDHPRNVVFDEMHYGKYASLYLKRTFFFDANPPLGKMLIALSGYFAGFDGEFDFEKIGTPYSDSVPLWSLRFVPAICGSLLTPTVYMILTELGLSQWTGFLAGLLVLLDTAILAQSRYILLESIMLIFALGALFCVLRFRRYHSNPFCLRWWFWITAAAFNMGCAFCVKYLALYSCCLCSLILLRDFWKRLSNKNLTNLQLIREFVTQVFLVCFIPTVIYVGSFYVHLKILTKAGVHDSLMTSAFQASLEGGLSSIVRGQPLEIAHGSQITLRHTHGKTCWLHSHEHVYPVRYDDGRGSSHQQQVSCYSFKDVNNWWIVKRPEREDLAVQEPLDVIKHGEVIQLVHGMTHRALNSHDVAAPVSPHNQEVSCYIDYNISMASENLWKVDIVNSLQSGDKWTSIGSQVRLVHETTGQALKFSSKLYPEWGFHQNEVVADRVIDQLDTVWNVEEHRYTKNDEDKKTLERELFNHELIPQEPTYLSFVDKFIELQVKMLLTNQENVQNHNYASDPSEWPFLTRGIAYFISKQSNAQVHLIGNILIWYSGTLSVLVYCILLTYYLLRRRRLCCDLPDDVFQQFLNVGEILLGGYLIHLLPFLFYDRTLFVHHYLSAYLYKIMLTAFIVSHFNWILTDIFAKFKLDRLFVLSVLAWLLGAVYVFWRFCAFSYGFFPLSADEVRALQWKDTWDFIIHKP